MTAHQLRYSVLPGKFAICRFSPDSAIPEWASGSKFFSITRTTDELSIVSPEELVAPGIQAEKGWACLALQGPFPFEMTGVLAAVLHPLAGAEIGIFAISTFDTDYVLIKEDSLRTAEETLRQAGLERISEANST